MATHTDILMELEAVAPVLAAQKVGHPFDMPPGYFGRFPEIMLQKVTVQQNGYDVPEGYFDQFAEKMLGRVRRMEVQHELNEVAPMLNRIPKAMPFYVPDGYFDREIDIPSHHQPAKVVSMGTSTWRRWAVAASVLAMLSLGWLFLNRSQPANTAYSMVSTEEINQMLDDMDENKLSNLLEDNAIEAGFTKLLLLAGSDVESNLRQLSTDELKTYLESHQMPEKGI